MTSLKNSNPPKIGKEWYLQIMYENAPYFIECSEIRPSGNNTHKKHRLI